ncbi:MAG TPA: glucose 1-dehydrogenase [Planctomycetota bacterium]|nr:glucose 1-dehydrogenase [Planctomycetota bacterium]
MTSLYPSFDLKGQTVLITGAARGLGAAIARACAHAGADIALGLRDKKTGGDLIRDIEALGRRALPLQMDVLKLDQIRKAINQTVKAFGKLDILVNNAGGGVTSKAEDVREEDFDNTVALNQKATFFASQAAAKVMIPRKSGRIINLSSQAGFVALPGESVYCMSKAAVSHLTKCMAVEWGQYNITVNAVAPTFIHTPGTEGDLANPEFQKHVLSMIKLGRIGEPVDVAGAVVFLASPAAALITGTTILIDGGWTAH